MGLEVETLLSQWHLEHLRHLHGILVLHLWVGEHNEVAIDVNHLSQGRIEDPYLQNAIR